jgi:hypothetical protein
MRWLGQHAEDGYAVEGDWWEIARQIQRLYALIAINHLA